MTHVRTSPYYLQSNGKIETRRKTLKGASVRVKTPLSPEDSRRVVAGHVAHYNEVRLHSAIGYVAPADKLAGREPAIFAERDRKLDEARERRRVSRAARRPELGNPLKCALHGADGGATMGDGLGGGEGSAATRPERRPRGQDRREGGRTTPGFPLRDWYESGKSINRFTVILGAVIISRTRFLHFTLNQHSSIDRPLKD